MVQIENRADSELATLLARQDLIELPLLPQGAEVFLRNSGGVRGILSVDNQGLHWRPTRGAQCLWVLDELLAWEARSSCLLVTCKHEEELLEFEATASRADGLRLALDHLNWRRRAQSSSGPLRALICRHCGAPVELRSHQAPAVCFCESCFALFRPEAEVLTDDGFGFYNFTKDGSFRFLGTERQLETRYPKPSEGGFVPFVAIVRPLLERCMGQLAWSAFFFLLMGVLWWTWWVPQVTYAIGLCGVLSSVCLVFAGYYWSGLMMRSLLKPYILRPAWDAIAESSLAGRVDEAERLIVERELTEHPGVIASLAVGLYKNGERERALEWSERAWRLCPDHPVLRDLVARFKTGK